MDELLTAAADVLRREARAALDELGTATGDPADNLALASLVAHLFAVGSVLARSSALPHSPNPQEEAIATVPDEPPFVRAKSLKSSLTILASMSSPVDPFEFYGQVVAGLEAIEETLLALDPAEQDALPPTTRLRGSGDLPLDGVVWHWIGREGGLGKLRAELRTQAEELGLSVPPRQNPRPSDDLARLRLLWSVDGRPGPSLSRALPRQRTSGLLGEVGSEISDLLEFRLALCPLPQSAHPLFRINPEGNAFHAQHPDSLHDLAAAAEDVDAILNAAAEERIHLLVLPELMVCEGLRARVGSFLRNGGRRWPFAVAAGSFHFAGDGTSSPPLLPVNEAVLFGHRGERLFGHQKSGRFRVDRGAVEKFPDWFPDRPAKLQKEIVEQIRYGGQVQVLDTDLGLLAVAICADLSTQDSTSLESLYQEIRPDLLVVVSMTPETRRFEEVIQRFAMWEVATLFVNAASICPPRQVLAAADLALMQLPGSPPTRFRWRRGGKQQRPVEVSFFHPPQGARRDHWVRATDSMRETGHRWLTAGGRTLGLVLDLGPLVRWALSQRP